MDTDDRIEQAIERAALAHFHATRAFMVGVEAGRRDEGAERAMRSLVWQWADQDDARDRVRDLLANPTGPREGNNRLTVGDDAAIDVLRDAGVLPWPDEVPIPDLAAAMKGKSNA